MKASTYLLATLTLATAAVAMPQPAAAQYSAGNFGAYGYRPLTLYESRARGQAELVRARGQRNLLDSEAAINVEQARSMNLDNRLQSTQTYFAMRNINTEQRFGTPEEREAQRQRNNAKRLFRYGQEGRPLRPTDDQLDPVTGQISWPLVLNAPQYEPFTQRLDSMFAARAQMQDHLNYEQIQKLTETTDALLAELKNNIRDMPSNTYLDAKNFIEALAYEAKHQTG